MRKLIIGACILLGGAQTVFATELDVPKQLIGLCNENGGNGVTKTDESDRGIRYKYTCTVNVYDIDAFQKDQTKGFADNFYATLLKFSKKSIFRSGPYFGSVTQAPISNVSSNGVIALTLYAECVPDQNGNPCDEDILNRVKSKLGDFSKTKVELLFSPAPSSQNNQCGGYYNESCGNSNGEAIGGG